MFGRNRYEEDYDDLDETGTSGAFIRPQRLEWVDYVVALVLGVFATVFAWALSYKGLHPDLWADCATAAGLRPAETLTPGYWRLLARGIFNVCGVAGGISMIIVLGKVFLGALVALAYLTFKEILLILVSMIETNHFWPKVLVRFACAVTAVLFLCAEPVWSLGAGLSSALLEAFLFSLIVFLLAKFLGAGRVMPAYGAMFLLGLLGAETPLGLIALFGFWLIFYILLTKGGQFHNQLLQPLLQQSSKWYLTFFWAVGLGIGIAVNILSFKAFDGLTANGLTMGDIPLRYASQLWHTFIGAATGPAWVVGAGATLLPFILGVGMLRRATDQDGFLNYHVGIVFFIIGCLAYSQVASLNPLWFWMLNDAIQVPSKLLLFLCAQMAAVAILASLAVALVDAFFRDHQRLAAQFDADLEDNLSGTPVMNRVVRLTVFSGVAALLIAGVVPGRVQTRPKQMLGLIDDYVREVVTEAGDAKLLFTDGFYDCAYELESARRGGELRCIAVQPSPYARKGVALRTLMQDDEDKLCSDVGGANILRTWQRDKPERLESCAMQLGLDLWRQRAGRDYPPVSGVVAKTKWADDTARIAGIKTGYGLAERILALYGSGGPAKVAGKFVNDLFLFMQWRISRLARVRAEIFDRAGETKLAKAELNIAETLDDKNESLKRILEAMARLRSHLMSQMTPREGLHFALVRADFPLARRYAESVLDADPDDADANFGMGMDYLLQEQYNRAEEYLRRCLKRRSKEPAIWNNIAVLQYRQGRYEEARQNALKALELLPDSAEVKDTLRDIDKAIAEAAEKKEEAPSTENATPPSGSSEKKSEGATPKSE